jgi:hypothetical protein
VEFSYILHPPSLNFIVFYIINNGNKEINFDAILSIKL